MEILNLRYSSGKWSVVHFGQIGLVFSLIRWDMDRHFQTIRMKERSDMVGRSANFGIIYLLGFSRYFLQSIAVDFFSQTSATDIPYGCLARSIDQSP
jgi:hypothetical protein